MRDRPGRIKALLNRSERLLCDALAGGDSMGDLDYAEGGLILTMVTQMADVNCEKSAQRALSS
jgi:hypothetical protein